MMFKFIAARKVDISVSKSCRLFGVSQSGYYAWKRRPASRRQRDDMVLLADIRNAFSLSSETYGSPRTTADLKADGFAVGRRRVARLMRSNGFQAKRKRRFRRTTDSCHVWPSASNILERNITAQAPNQKWAVDISYIWKAAGWLCLAIVMDLHSRRIVG